MVLTKKFSDFATANLADPTNKLVGLSGSNNAQIPNVVSWTTSTRPTPPYNGLLGFNTDLSQYEFYDTSIASWVQIGTSGDVAALIARLASYVVGNGASMIGLQNQGSEVVNQTVQALANAAFIVQTNNGSMADAQALGDLTSGILKSTTVTGLLSISVPLTSIDSLTTAANEMLYTTGINAYATTPLTALARTLLADADAASMRATLSAAQSGVNSDITALQGITGVIESPSTIQMATTGMITTSTTATNYYNLSAYDTNALSYTIFATLTAGNPAICDLSDSVTKAGGYIYRAGGTKVALADGGTNAALVAAAGAIPYSTGSALALLAPGTTGQLLQSNGTSAPSWTTATFPTSVGATGTILRSNGTNWIASTATFATTYTASNLLYSNGANTVTGLATANNSVLVTSGIGVPSLSTTLPSGLTIPGYQTTITPAALTKTDDTNVTLTLGGSPTSALLAATSLTLGWTGILSGTRGGTGVNNGASTITLGGSLTFSGAFATTFTVTGATSVTLPTSGTLVSLAANNTFTKRQAVTPVSISSSSGSTPTDGSASNYFTTALTENTTLANPSNLVAGTWYTWVITQNASAAKTVALDTLFVLVGASWTMTTTLSAKAVVSGFYDGTNILYVATQA